MSSGRRRHREDTWPQRPRAHAWNPARLLVPLGLCCALTTLAPVGSAGDRLTIEVLRVSNGASPFAGDGRLLATLSPNGDGFRESGRVLFRLGGPATVTLVISHGKPAPRVVGRVTATLEPGVRSLSWRPPPTLPARTYRATLLARGARGGNAIARGAVFRLQGVSASFATESARPGSVASLLIATDARALTLQAFQCGPQLVTFSHRNDRLDGVPAGAPTRIDWRTRRSGPHRVEFTVGNWRSGLYYVRITAGDGRVGYAPLVVRPRTPARSRVAVVLPTYTWQAYNFADRDGDGRGDTWYDGWEAKTVALGRAYENRGVPPHFRTYDLPFLLWLAKHRKSVDVLADSDLDAVPDGRALARDYDLVVFPGHEEYVTDHVYDVVERYRDLGGNLIFLSANNFFWRVTRHGSRLRRTRQWRDLGRPEAALVGAAYIGNDAGERRARFVVRGARAAPWFVAGTQLSDGSSFGWPVGIEIDARRSQSPPGTVVLAELEDVFGQGKSAEMTYYETPRGAKVFAAGALDFSGTVRGPVVTTLLSNLWERLARP